MFVYIKIKNIKTRCYYNAVIICRKNVLKNKIIGILQITIHYKPLYYKTKIFCRIQMFYNILALS